MGTAHREAVLDEAVRAGKFSPARKEHYRRLYDADPVGTEQVLALLASSLPVGELGHAGPLDTARPPQARAADSGYPREWLNGMPSSTRGRVTVAGD
jgi:hypothetical protein